MNGVHVLKTLPPFFEAVERGDKTFEVRKDDRAFQTGDLLVLTLFDPQTLINYPPEIRVTVSYVLRGGQFGIEDGYVVLGIRREVES